MNLLHLDGEEELAGVFAAGQPCYLSFLGHLEELAHTATEQADALNVRWLLLVRV